MLDLMIKYEYIFGYFKRNIRGQSYFLVRVEIHEFLSDGSFGIDLGLIRGRSSSIGIDWGSLSIQSRFGIDSDSIGVNLRSKNLDRSVSVSTTMVVLSFARL